MTNPSDDFCEEGCTLMGKHDVCDTRSSKEQLLSMLRDGVAAAEGNLSRDERVVTVHSHWLKNTCQAALEALQSPHEPRADDPDIMAQLLRGEPLSKPTLQAAGATIRCLREENAKLRASQPPGPQQPAEPTPEMIRQGVWAWSHRERSSTAEDVRAIYMAMRRMEGRNAPPPVSEQECTRCHCMERAQKFIGDPRVVVGIPFTHWSKDPLVPYAGCECSSCKDARGVTTTYSGTTKEVKP